MRFWKTIIWAVFILVICILPSDDIERVRFINIPYMDKFVHLGLYFILTLFLISDFAVFSNVQPKRNILIIAVFSIALSYGILIELIQLWFTSSRSADVWDAIADGLGVIIALLNYRWINRVTSGWV